MSYIYGIATANPQISHTQDDFVSFYSNATTEIAAKRKIKLVAHKSGIAKRHSVIKDFSLPPNDFTFFGQHADLQPTPMLAARMAIYQREAIALSVEAVGKLADFEQLKSKITHVISVTCTGLFAPGLDIELIEQLNLSPETSRSSINFMGCNAAVLAFKQAHQICKSEADALVLIVCVELCTLHFQGDFSDDYIVSNLLFADGAAATLIGSKPGATRSPYSGLSFQTFRSRIVSEGKKDMAWRLSEQGFLMNLTSYVSPLLNKHMPELLDALQIKDTPQTHWAIHPGGKRILDDLCKNLNLSQQQLQPSYETLQNYGNMSSATILFVLKNLIENTKIGANDKIFVAGFGPGLNIETAVLVIDN